VSERYGFAYFYTDIGEETYFCPRDRPLMTESEVGVLLGQPHWFLDVRGFRWKVHEHASDFKGGLQYKKK